MKYMFFYRMWYMIFWKMRSEVVIKEIFSWKMYDIIVFLWMVVRL